MPNLGLELAGFVPESWLRTDTQRQQFPIFKFMGHYSISYSIPQETGTTEQ